MKSKSEFNLFPPIVNKPEIQSIDDVVGWLDKICENEKSYSDTELSVKLDEVFTYCAGGNPTRSFYFIQHRRSEELVRKRVTDYCRKNKISLDKYNGTLPFRQFSIPFESKTEQRKEKLKTIRKKIFFNKLKIWRHINWNSMVTSLRLPSVR